MAQERTGADILIETLTDLGVEVVFGYPGGAVLPIYDAIFKQDRIRISSCARRAVLRMRPRVMPARPASRALCW